MVNKQIIRLQSNSLAIGAASELINFGIALLCGYRLSDMLEYTLKSEWQRMYCSAIFVSFILVLGAVPRYFLSVLRSKTALTDTQKLRNWLYVNILSRCFKVVDRGELNVRLTGDVRAICSFVQQICPKAFSGSVIIVCATLLLLFEDWRIGLIFFGMNLTQLLPIFVYERWTREIYNQTHNDEEAYCSWILEGYGGIRTIKAYAVEEWFMEKYHRLNRSVVKSGRKGEQAITVENIVFGSIDCLLNYGSYVVIGLFVLWGGVGIERTPIMIVLGGYLFSSISPIFNWRIRYYEYQEACKRLKVTALPDNHIDDGTVFNAHHISKNYDERTILRDISLSVHKGDRILLKGDNGSGKSTLLRILMGLEDPDEGTVSRYGSITQYAFAFQEEPEINISGKAIIEESELAECVDVVALRKHLREFGIDTMLEEPLSSLSAGERKKFYLALALAHNSEVLILDEPTNHIDDISRQYLCKQLCNRTGTLIVCTHGEEVNCKWNRIIRMVKGECHEE